MNSSMLTLANGESDDGITEAAALDDVKLKEDLVTHDCDTIDWPTRAWWV